MRKLIKAIGAIILFFVIAGLFCIRPVDKTLYNETDYYKNTIKRLERLSATLPEAKKSVLMAGWGKAGITPPVGVPLAGYGARKGEPCTGIHDSLFVRVITLKAGSAQIFLLGYDALLLHPPVARIIEDSIRTRFNLNPDQFLFSATHTHSGPGGWGQGWLEKQFAGPPDPRVKKIFIDSTLVAIERALNDLDISSYAVGSFSAPQFIRNRLVGDKGQVDSEFIFLALLRDGNVKAILTTYSAHATVLSAHNMLISGDYPGFLSKKLEDETSGVALFAVAGLGSHGPRGKGEAFERAKYIGESLADSVIARLPDLDFHPSAAIQYLRLKTDMGPLQLRVSNSLRLSPWLGKKIFHIYDSYFQAIAIDNFVIIGCPGELSGELALQVKEHAKQQNKKVTITSFNGCYLGYITPAQYYHLNEYETRLMSFFGPYTGSYFVDLMNRIVGG